MAKPRWLLALSANELFANSLGLVVFSRSIEMTRLFLIASLALALAGCASQQSVVDLSIPNGDLAALSKAQQVSGIKGDSRHAWLYVSGYDNNVVGIFDLQQTGFPRVGLMRDGVIGPTGLAVDRKGTLYVSNGPSSAVTIYPPGKTAPRLTLTQSLGFPRCVAVDRIGNVYVCNQGDVPSIAVFPPGKTAPAKQITDPSIQEPTDIAFDAAGDLFFSDTITGVSEIRAGSQNVVSLGLQGLAGTNSVGVDPVSKDLFVGSSWNGIDEVLVYETGNVNPSRILTDGAPADSETFGKISQVEYFYVPEWYDNEVRIFKQGSNQPSASIALDGLSYPVGIAFKPAGVP